jgi:superfamily II DNA or RNA helicase
MDLRPYQSQAVELTLEAWKTNQSVLFVHPTGTGKTVVIAELCRTIPAERRIMILAHRHELIRQLQATVGAVTGSDPDIEQASRYADSNGWAAQTICSSIQTQVSGRKAKRMERFDPFDFDLLVIDEAHHATARTYRRVVQHYSANPNLKILGCTATPDRHDQEALGQVFDTVSHSYTVLDAASDGWLVPIKQIMIYVESMQWDNIRHSKGDLNEKDIAREMEFEGPLQEIVVPSYKISKGRKTLVFAPSCAIAERMCEMFNRYEPEVARYVHGKTPAVERDQIFHDYKYNIFRILCNVGVATEGFDEPGISAVIMARPTQSRALYSQMAGRGMRPFPPVLVNEGDTPHDRKTLIAGSDKPDLLLIDLVGNSTRHKLASAISHLGGNVSDEVLEAATCAAEEEARRGEAEEMDPMERLERAAGLVARKAAEIRQRKQRQQLTAKVGYRTRSVDPFDMFDMPAPREMGVNELPATDKQLNFLGKLTQGLVNVYGLHLSRKSAGRYITDMMDRMSKKLCTPKQAQLLVHKGYDPKDLTLAEASEIISKGTADGWKAPSDRR